MVWGFLAWSGGRPVNTLTAEKQAADSPRGRE